MEIIKFVVDLQRLDTSFKVYPNMDHSKILCLLYIMSIKVHTWRWWNNSKSSCFIITKKLTGNSTMETATLFWPCLRSPIATRHCMKHYIIYFEPVFLIRLQYRASYQNIHSSFSWYGTYIQLSSYLYVILIWIFVIIFNFIISMWPFRTLAILLRCDIQIIWTSSPHLLCILWYPHYFKD